MSTCGTAGVDTSKDRFEEEFGIPCLYEHYNTAIVHINDLILHGRYGKRGITNILNDLIAHAPGLELLSSIGLPDNKELHAPYYFVGQCIIYLGCVLIRGWRVSIINYTLPHQNRFQNVEECEIKNRNELSEFEKYMYYLADATAKNQEGDTRIVKYMECKGSTKPIGEMDLECNESLPSDDELL